MTPPIHTRADDALAAVLGRDLQSATVLLIVYLVVAAAIVAAVTYL